MQLSEPALLILVSLADGPKHGYAMMEDVHRLAGVKLGPGTLYGALVRLERSGLIEPLPSTDRRRPYKLTGSGARHLEDELAQLQRVASVGLHRLATA